MVQESDHEVDGLQQQLASNQQEVSSLRNALATASSQHSQHQQLVEELTGVVQQQKTRMQVRGAGGAAVACFQYKWHTTSGSCVLLVERQGVCVWHCSSMLCTSCCCNGALSCDVLGTAA